jgi:hypothetical protein
MKQSQFKMKKRGLYAFVVFVFVAFLFWILFMRKREGLGAGKSKSASFFKKKGPPAKGGSKLVTVPSS